MSVGTRLKEERKRLGYSQEAWGKVVGITKRSQIQYEKDEYSPTAVYLTLADQIGADVGYILTGRHERLTETEAELVALYRKARPAMRAMATVALSGGMEAPPLPTPRPVPRGGKAALVKVEPSSAQPVVTKAARRRRTD